MEFDNDKLFEEIASLLARGVEVTVAVKGRSMRPLLVEGRDHVTLRRCIIDDVRLGDVVLARESGCGRVLLHRVIRRDGDTLVLQGDGNRVQTETVSASEVVGVAVAFMRNGKTYTARSLAVRVYSSFILAFMSLRRSWVRLRINAGYVKDASIGHRTGILLSCIVGIVSVVLSLAFIYFSKHVIDVATRVVDGNVAVLIAVLAALVALQLLCSAAGTWIGARLHVGLGNALRHATFSRLMSIRWIELERFHTGDIVNRVERDTASVVSVLAGTVPAFIVSFVQFAIALAFFCVLDPWLPWLVVCGFPILLLGGRFYMKKMYHYARLIRRSDSMIQSVIQESLQQRTVVKALEQGTGRVGTLDCRQSELRGQVMGRTRFSILSRSFVSAAFAIGYLVVFSWGVVLLGAGAITFGTMAAFLQLVGKVQYPIFDMARLVPSLVDVLASVDRLREIEQLSAEDVDGRVSVPCVPDIVFDNVTFDYGKGEAPVLKCFSYVFPAGSCTAVLGVTGRGKTTLVRLLLALVEPIEGSVSLVCGDQRYAVSSRTRCNFTYVPQGNTLFSGTVRDNLLMGNPEATDDEMRKALHTAEADFVFSLPEGIDTPLGEQGGGLSEGQAQRIAVARAILRKSHILLFDEATSALDAATESRLVANLRNGCAGKTLVFVTHHEAVASVCDNVLRL